METKQLGYYTLPNGTKLHFSINAWYNLEEDCGMKAAAWMTEFGDEIAKEDRNEFVLLDLLADLCAAAGKAYAQEEDLEYSINRFKMRNILLELSGEEIIALSNLIFGTSTADDRLGGK
jgi:hypothetical protein